MSSYCDSLVQLHGLLSSQPAPIPLLQPVGGGDSLRQATSGRNSCQTPTRGSNLTLPGKPESRSPWGPGYWFLKAPSGKNKLSRDPQKKKKKKKGCVWGSSHRGSAETNLTSTHEDVGSIPGLVQWIQHCSELWSRLQMWFGSGVAVAVV